MAPFCNTHPKIDRSVLCHQFLFSALPSSLLTFSTGIVLWEICWHYVDLKKKSHILNKQVVLDIQTFASLSSFSPIPTPMLRVLSVYLKIHNGLVITIIIVIVIYYWCEPRLTSRGPWAWHFSYSYFSPGNNIKLQSVDSAMNANNAIFN